jgi:hypothetical protein
MSSPPPPIRSPAAARSTCCGNPIRSSRGPRPLRDRWPPMSRRAGADHRCDDGAGCAGAAANLIGLIVRATRRRLAGRLGGARRARSCRAFPAPAPANVTVAGKRPIASPLAARPAQQCAAARAMVRLAGADGCMPRPCCGKPCRIAARRRHRARRGRRAVSRPSFTTRRRATTPALCRDRGLRGAVIDWLTKTINDAGAGDHGRKRAASGRRSIWPGFCTPIRRAPMSWSRATTCGIRRFMPRTIEALAR